MDINLMRQLDKKLGIPLCFLLSVLSGIKKLFKRTSPPRETKKILFIELSEMGSMVLAFSLFKKTKELFPDAELFFLTFKKNRYAIDILDVIPKENVTVIDDRHLFVFLKTALSSLRSIRKNKITTVLDMEFFSRFTSIYTFFCGAKEIVGYFRYYNEGLYKGRFLTHRVQYNPQIHTSYNLLNLIYALIESSKDLPTPKKSLNKDDLIIPRKAEISMDARKQIFAKLNEINSGIIPSDKIILLNPNASDIIPLRRWPVDHYIELARELLKREGISIVLTGIETERQTCESICRAINHKKCLNFSGYTRFSELLDLYKISAALITNDSGPAHFSTMTDIQTFVFFGPETPKLYGPLGKNCHVFYSNLSCSPCVSIFNHRKSPCRDNKCLKTISVKEVYDKVSEKLDLCT
ncbi:glycosyltransferase family 9 protein [Acidobacteriota bacterium]